MALTVKNDEQIKVGLTPGLVADSSSFTFNGAQWEEGVFKPDYRGFEIVISELTGRGILVKGLDYSWNTETGRFDYLQDGDVLTNETWFNVHFQPLAQPLILSTYSLINTSFFIRNINIPNLENGVNKVAEVNKANIQKVNSFIQKYEPECLKKFLGYALYKKLLTETSDRINELIYGAEFTDIYGELRKWEGLVHDTNISLIANYVYFFIEESDATQKRQTAVAVSKSQTATSVSPQDRMIAAWNFMSEEVRVMVQFLLSKKINGALVYPEFTHIQACETTRMSRKINPFGF